MVTAPDGRPVCGSREHARLGCLAEITVTFGELGTTAWDKDAVWPETWGYSFYAERKAVIAEIRGALDAGRGRALPHVRALPAR